MPRRPRLHVPGGFYHVILRGNHRQPIFFRPEDRDRLDELVAEVINRFRMRVHAYCWMTNHLHLAIQVSDIPLSAAMMRIASRYARYVQRRIPTTGHLFERRYRAWLVDADSYLLELVRYIHLNPVRAGIMTDPAEYPWSGHRAYLNTAATPWLTTGLTLSLLGREAHAARDAYRRFVLAGIGIKVESLYQGHPEDPRILGDDRFLSQLPLSTRLPQTALSLDDLIQHLCLIHSLDPDALAARGRQRKPAKVRALVLHHAARLKLATLNQLASRFGRSPSTLSETLEHYRASDPALFRQPLGSNASD